MVDESRPRAGARSTTVALKPRWLQNEGVGLADMTSTTADISRRYHMMADMMSRCRGSGDVESKNGLPSLVHGSVPIRRMDNGLSRPSG